MSLTKRLYTAHSTYITAQNLNDIQDAIIALEAYRVADAHDIGVHTNQIAALQTAVANKADTSRVNDIDSDVITLKGQWTVRTIETGGGNVTMGLVAGKIYLLVIGKQNTTATGYQGLYIISAYGSDGNGTTITTVLASSAATVATVNGDPLTLKITSASSVNYVVATLIKLNS